MRPLVIDNFAGGGGASTGIERALGRPIDIAINHDEAAIAVHAANHPHTRHLCQSIMAIDPLDATGGAPVLLVWFSPDCKHHSKAKGGKPRDKNIRDLAQIVPHWLERLRKATPGGRGAPEVIMLENVEEFRQWGPLDEKGMPIKERRGEEFKLWIARIKRQGYKVEHRELRACDYGAPTSRKRLFLVARRDGQPIVWPEPTHGKPGSPEVESGERLPWRTAAECIDWSIPCPSIFDRKRPLKPATCRRIAAGVMRYVVNSARPFIVPVTNTGWNPGRCWSADEPLRTVTTAKGGEMAVVAPVFARTAHGEVDRSGKRRGRGDHPVDVPFPTVTASQDSALIGAALVKLRNHSAGEDPAAPLGAVTAGGLHHAAVAATLVTPFLTRGAALGGEQSPSGRSETWTHSSSKSGNSFNSPDPTKRAKSSAAPNTALPNPATTSGIKPPMADRSKTGGESLTFEAKDFTCDGERHAAVAGFLHKYRPNSDGAPADGPMPTVTANSFVKRGGGAPPLAVAVAHMEQANGGGVIGHDAREPVSTVTRSGSQQRVVETTLIEADALPTDMMERAVRTAAFLIKYYGNEVDGHGFDAPLGTVTTRDRFAVITVTIDAITFVLTDIGMRMLEPRELANAQGFPRDYILDPVCWYVTDTGNRKYGRLPKSQQIAKIGNAVCPVMSEALVRANISAGMFEQVAA